MELVILSFIAGALTVAAPCVLPLLPVIVGGTVVSGSNDAKASARRPWFTPLVIAGSLAVSVVVFTLLLRATTALLGVPQMVWNVTSGGIVALLGVSMLVPAIWDRLMIATGLHLATNRWLGASYARKGLLHDVLVGAALGPVFTSCSPTYGLIVAAVLPSSFAQGLVYLCFYGLGLAMVLLVVAVAGQSAVRKLGWLSNPLGWFRRTIGVLFIVVGIAVLFGLDRSFQSFVLDQGWYDPVMRLEQRLNIE